MLNLKGKTILITGAAGRIGSSVARLASSAGADVVLGDISLEKLNFLESQLKADFSNQVFSIESDITSVQGIEHLINRSLECVDNITSAVHSAYPVSAGWGTRFEDLKSDYLYQDLSMQLGSAILFSKQIIAYFCGRGGGDLVHISSIQGIRPPKFEHYQGLGMTSPIEYAAIKSGIISITGWLAKYYSNRGIRVNCVSPGGVLADQAPLFLERYRNSCTNIGMLMPDQVASSVVFLLSSESAAINGHNLVVDDGWSL